MHLQNPTYSFHKQMYPEAKQHAFLVEIV